MFAASLLIFYEELYRMPSENQDKAGLPGCFYSVHHRPTQRNPEGCSTGTPLLESLLTDVYKLILVQLFKSMLLTAAIHRSSEHSSSG